MTKESTKKTMSLVGESKQSCPASQIGHNHNVPLGEAWSCFSYDKACAEIPKQKEHTIPSVMLVHFCKDALVWRGSHTQSGVGSLHDAGQRNVVHCVCSFRAIERVSRCGVDNLHERENKHDWSPILILVKNQRR